MFSFNSRIFFISAIFWLASCGSENTAKLASPTYFSLKDFFSNESKRLEGLNLNIKKSISDNGQTEGQILQINNWKNELSLFSESDINKPAWKNSYEVKEYGDSTLYIAKEANLRTRKIKIGRNEAKQVNTISIENATDNFLYKTHEALSYSTDSGYVIVKHQEVKVLGTHNYIIRGNFK